MNDVTFTYTPSVGNYLKAAKEVEKRTAWFALDKIFGIVIAVVGIYFLTMIPMNERYWGILFIILGVNDLLGIFHVNSIVIRIRFRNNPKNRHQQKVVFRADCILYSYDGLESRIEWTFYTQGFETPDAYLLFYGKSQYSLIPKATIDAEQKAALEVLFKSKIPSFTFRGEAKS